MAGEALKTLLRVRVAASLAAGPLGERMSWSHLLRKAFRASGDVRRCPERVPGFVPNQRRLACTAVVLSLLLCLAGTPDAVALTLGPETVESSLGQPLRATFRLHGASPDLADASCIRLGSAAAGDGLPQVTSGTLTLERRGADVLAVLRSTRPINDPIVRVTLVSTCEASSRRDYVLLLDLPAMSVPPSVAAESRAERVAGEPTGQPSARTEPRDPVPVGADRTAAEQPASPTRRARSVTVATSASAVTARDRRVPRAAQASAAETTAMKGSSDQLRIDPGARLPRTIEDAAMAALAVPRLRLTSDLSFDPGVGTAPPSAIAQDLLQQAIAEARRNRLRAAPIEEDLAPRLEADFIVAKRKIEELQAQLAAQSTAGRTAPQAAASAASQREDLIRSWLPLLLAALAGLGLVLLLLIRRRRTAAASFEEQALGLPEEGTRSDREPSVRSPLERRRADDAGEQAPPPTAASKGGATEDRQEAAERAQPPRTRVPVHAAASEQEPSTAVTPPPKGLAAFDTPATATPAAPPRSLDLRPQGVAAPAPPLLQSEARVRITRWTPAMSMFVNCRRSPKRHRSISNSVAPTRPSLC